MSGRSTVAGADPRRHAERNAAGRFAPKASPPPDAAAAAPAQVRETRGGAATVRKDDTPAPGPVATTAYRPLALAAAIWRDGLRAVRR